MYRARFRAPRVVVGLIIVSAVVFLFTQFPLFATPDWLVRYFSARGQSTLALAAQRYGLFVTLFSLFPALIRGFGWVWQFLTYMFLHGSIWHIFFNMYALLLFGRPLEERWGSGKFFLFYVLTGIGAGIVTYFWNAARNPFVPTIGASGAIFGVLLAFGLEFPDTVLLLFFIIPLRARYAVFIYGGLELVLLVTGAAPRISQSTHLAGLFFGYLYYILIIRRPSISRRRAFHRARVPARKGNKRTPSNSRKKKGIEMARAVKIKLREGQALSRDETAFLLRLKKAYQAARGICEYDEFDLEAESCTNCEDFYGCLYRFILEQR